MKYLLSHFSEARLIYRNAEQPAEPQKNIESKKELTEQKPTNSPDDLHKLEMDQAKRDYNKIINIHEKYNSIRCPSGKTVGEIRSALDNTLEGMRQSRADANTPEEKIRIEKNICYLITKDRKIMNLAIREHYSNQCDKAVSGKETIPIQEELALYRNSIELGAYDGNDLDAWVYKMIERIEGLNEKNLVPKSLEAEARDLQSEAARILVNFSKPR